jgi:uncharacterized membrane protein YccC
MRTARIGTLVGLVAIVFVVAMFIDDPAWRTRLLVVAFAILAWEIISGKR